jgi:hypothetical protein
MKVGSSILLTITAFIAMTFQTTVFAADRVFECQVSSFNYSRLKGFGIGGWKEQNTQIYTAPIKSFNGEYSETTQTMQVVGPYEIVFDVRWEAATLNNDDVSTKADPKLKIEARVQERMPDGKTRILDTASDIGRPSYGAAVTRKIFAQVQLTNLAALSEHLSDPKASNFAISENFKGADVEGLFDFSCNTGI